MSEYRPELMALMAHMPKADRQQWTRMTGRDRKFVPDVVIAPDGKPYLYRWYVVPLNRDAPPEVQIMFHIQVTSDPERPLHDHPWINVSHILAGGYEEQIDMEPPGPVVMFKREPGDVIRRPATAAHRLVLPAHVPYTMSLFTTGPKIRAWGFWYPDGWHDNKRHVADRNGVSVHLREGEMA